MSRRSFVYVVTALVLVAGGITAMAVDYARDAPPEPVVAEPEPKLPDNPSTMFWADGTALDVAKPQDALLVESAKAELATLGISEKELNSRGYAIELTVDPKAQQMAEVAVDTARAGQPANLRASLVAVDPKTGRIVAYKGYQWEKDGIDYARNWFNPGTAFTPFALVALLHKGKGLDTTYDGTSNRKFGGITIRNTEGDCTEKCTVAEAMKKSVNTVFADIAFNEVGLKAVATAAIEAGIPANIGREKRPLDAEPDLNLALGGGKYVARPVDMAGAYATFASNGTKRAPHMIATVKDPANGEVIYEGDVAAKPTPAFDKNDPANNAKIARTVTESLLPAGLPCAENRPCASKPGVHGCPDTAKTTRDDNCATWMVGYTPQISTAVWFGSDDNTPLKDATGARLTGKGLPGKAWQQFMAEYLKGKPVEQF